MNDPVILKRPAAPVDLAAYYAYIGERSPDAARRFRTNAEATFADLARSPASACLLSSPILAWRDFAVFG